MSMLTVIDDLVVEAEQQIRERAWVPGPADRSAAAKAAADLQAAVGDPQYRETLSAFDRLASLREALAALAIALAQVHGRLAWFLGAAVTALSPVLHWRELPSEGGSTFGAVSPTRQQYTEAEDAVRRLQSALKGVAAA
ncbi:hypothetical protein [Streptomyces sp. R44]|uniref:Uncharacterized protein n=1 Tax=Streptomyces sp. R44 TaxID=3238633 RepID=A0AB39TAN5_9ACTN